MKTKDKKLAQWRKRRNAPVICEDIHFLTSNTAIQRRMVTVCDHKADSEWDNDPAK
ncbi:hypothetical protein LCGC14_1303110 [marine sediment metagenome]